MRLAPSRLVAGVSDAAAARYQLRWAPLPQTNPTIISVTNANKSVTLGASEDAILNLGALTNAGGLSVTGGRRVRIIGGSITTPSGGGTISSMRAMIFANVTDEVFVEGVHMTGEGAGNFLTEGPNWFFASGYENCRVVIQNCRIGPVWATDEVGFTDNHPDCITTGGYSGPVLIDRCTLISDYQGIFLRSSLGTISGPVRISNVNIRGSWSARYLFWKGYEDGEDFDTYLDNVWLQPGANRSSGNVWPNESAPSPHTAQLAGALFSGSGAYYSWPNAASRIFGRINVGMPPGGDFVPANRVGANYVSPGYA